MHTLDMWWLSLGVFAAVVVVVAILLGLIIATAKSIDTTADKIWTAGKQIAGNTVAIWILEPIRNELAHVSEQAQSIVKMFGK